MSNIVLLGDSLTARWDWQKQFPQHIVRNLGRDGDTSQDLLLRLDSAVSLQPQKLFLMIGVNDLLSGGGPALLPSLEILLKELSRSLPEAGLFLQGLLPLCFPGCQEDNRRIETVNRQLSQMAGRLGFVYLPVPQEFFDSQGLPRPGCFLDGIHLSPLGYRIWAEALSPFL